MSKGKLFVIEGSDGSGKATQTKKIFERLKVGGVNVRQVSFPNYSSESSALIKMYLRGDFGKDANKVNAYASAAFYAVDRFAGFNDWKKFYSDGGIILADRYVTSNMAHQSVKFESSLERENFLNWLDDFEYNKLELPRPNITFFLNMPPEISAKFRNERGRRDIHEIDEDYMKKSYESYCVLAKKFGWKIIQCADKNFAKNIDEINDEIFEIISNNL